MIVPGYSSYDFSRSGVLTRIARGRGATLGVKKPLQHHCQQVYRLFNGTCKSFFLSKVALMALCFGDSRDLHTTYRGESCHNAKLNERDVRKVRTLRAAGYTYQQILAEVNYKVGKTNLTHILNRHTWRHI